MDIMKKNPVVVLPGTNWSFQVLTLVPYLWLAEAPEKVPKRSPWTLLSPKKNIEGYGIPYQGGSSSIEILYIHV